MVGFQLAAAPLSSLDDLESYDGDIETGSTHTATDALATPAFVPTPASYSPVRPRLAATPHHLQTQQRLSALQKYDELNMPQASNRSNSTSNFSPGAHRRSHPNLQHLSLAPLTPKYPITPSDYNAYVDPDTSQLHTSSSLSHIASMPSPNGILSQPGSRANSRTRDRKSKSSVSIRVESPAPRGALTSQGFGGKATASPNPQSKQHPTGIAVEPTRGDPSWLLQTGMALTEGSRESKGQSWLAKRASSTSLHSPAGDEYPNFEFRQARSGHTTPPRSRRGSRDRRKSRRDLAMTPAALAGSSAPGQVVLDELRPSLTISTAAPAHDYATIEPDWADSQTQAEIAADLEMELAEELENEELYSHDPDRYEELDFTRQGIEDEEKEIQKVVRARGFGFGKWVDGIVDVFLKMDDADEDEAEDKLDNTDHENATFGTEEDKDNEPLKRLNKEEEENLASDDEMEPAPQNPKSVWEDLAWFGRLVLRTAKS